MKANIQKVPIAAIDPNPFRQLHEYPYVERKVEALQRSIDAVGLWEGVIARKDGNRYQLAFGHHRVEAARRVGLDEVAVIVRDDLDEEKMLQFMGRENGEDYNADFLSLLETWEAAVKFSGRIRPNKSQPIEVARLLGWTRKADGSEDRMNHAASACNAAHALITGGYLGRDDLHEMSIETANQIVGRAQARMEQLEKLAQQAKTPRAELEQAKRQVGKAAKQTAEQARDGIVARKDLRGQVDVNTWRHAREAKKRSPLFDVFAANLADTIRKMLQDDAATEKLEAIAEVAGDVVLDDDLRLLARIKFELDELGERTVSWGKRLTPNKVHHLKPMMLEGQE